MEKAREFQKNIYFCFTDYAKAFDSVDHKELGKILKEMGILKHFSLLRNLYASQEATVKTGYGTELIQNWERSIQGCILLYCHPIYLTSMQSTSFETPGWMKHKLESRLPGEISTTSDMQMIPL